MRSPHEPRFERISIRRRTVGALLVLCALGAVYAAALPALRDHPPRPRGVGMPHPLLPPRIGQCETYTQSVCGTWTLQRGGVYRAAWSDGSTATIHVREFSGTLLRLSRVDHGSDLTAEYSGVVSAGRTVVSGNVRWTRGRESRAGSWTADWSPAPGARD